jgi:DNA-binding helix-hairpin-helix protein with protein kinase domain
MTRSVFTPAGRPLALGALLGRGGEGSVFALPDHPGRVAKLYHRRPARAKQDKLRHMAAVQDDALLGYCAWPQDTLHARDGAVLGFVMQDIGARRSIHSVYSPVDRLDVLPHAGFDTLLAVARNLAAAFCTLHAHGHVLGDVNQGNVVVDADARVLLIDCDSFQVQVRADDAPGALHLCEVGVGHFTPPELQGLASFAGCVRSVQHDNFGLALLVFHLLMGGRHPYAGVPRVAQAGETLEADIRALRYAYAPDAAQRGLLPPPRTVPLEVLPLTLRQLFVRAFTEPGLRGQRPAAHEWLRALDAARATLKPCPSQRLHHHPAHLPRCPWCALEAHDVVLFVDPLPVDTLVRPGLARATLATAWQRIEAVTAPAPVPVPVVDRRRVMGPVKGTIRVTGATAGLPGRRRWLLHLLLAGVFALAVLALAPGAPVLAAILGTLAFTLANSFAETPYRREVLRRRAAVDAARRALQSELDALDALAGPAGFRRLKARLRRVYEALDRLAQPAPHAPAARRGRAGRLRSQARRGPLERLLRAGPAVLTQYRQQAAATVAAAQPRLQAAAHRLAQAEADLAALEGWRWPSG